MVRESEYKADDAFNLKEEMTHMIENDTTHMSTVHEHAVIARASDRVGGTVTKP